MISKIIPIFVGKNIDGVITKYLLRDIGGQKASLPIFKEQIVVESIEIETNKVLEQMGLGWAFDVNKDLKSLFDEIMKFQGIFLEGSEKNAISNAVCVLKEALNPAEARDRRECMSFFSSNRQMEDTFSALEEESLQLKAKVDELTKALKRSEKSAKRSQRKLKEMSAKYQKEIELAEKHADFQQACDNLFSILLGNKSHV